jgi:hypothetical protein
LPGRGVTWVLCAKIQYLLVILPRHDFGTVSNYL